MNKPQESISHYTAGKNDVVDPKPGDQKPLSISKEPEAGSSSRQSVRETAQSSYADDAAATSAVKREMARSSQAARAGSQQFLGYSQAFSMAASDAIQQYFATLERNTQRYCRAVNTYLDAFRDELSGAGENDEQDQRAVRNASAQAYSQRTRNEDGRTQNQRT